MTRPGFDINQKTDAARPSAMLPMLGMTAKAGFGEPFPVQDVDGYLAALHASIGDAANLVRGNMLEAAKALGSEVPQAASYATMSFMPDPTNYGLMQWPGLQPEALRKISRENIAPQMVIRSRVTDLARYAGLSSHLWMPGWRIMMLDAKETPTAQDKKDIKDAESFIWNCSREHSYTQARERDAVFISSFETFLRSFVDDALTFDGWALWTDKDSRGGVRAFCNLPAGMIRLAVPTRGYKGNPKHFAVMVDENGNPIKPFTRDELTWRIRNVRLDPAVAGYGWCYDAKTEVLTGHGWKLFADADIAVDQFATMNLKTRNFEWQIATNKIQQKYSGKMYRIKSSTVDLLVTPNHRMLVRMHDAAKYLTIMTAEELYARKKGTTGNNVKLPSVSKWQGQELRCWNFAGELSDAQRPLMPILISGDDYCAFMGAYLSEGYVPNNVNGKNVYICQNETSKGYVPFKELLTRMLGAEPYHVRGEFVISRKALANHAKLYGRDCYTKCVPAEIMNATPRQIQIFLDYYLLGDGRSQQTNQGQYKSDRRGRLGGVYRSITTTSRQMADQLQELIQKAGYAATIHTTAARQGRMVHTGRVRKDGTAIAYDYMSEKVETYDVAYKGSEAHGFDIEETTYTGDIGCVTVPNGTLYVRRNGRPIWCGNSEIEMAVRLIQGFQAGIDLNIDTFTKSAIPNGMLLLKGDYFNQDQIDALMREWTNMKRGISKLWGMPVMAIPEGGDVELMQFMDMKGDDVRYKDHLNMMAGLICIVYNFPVRRLGLFASGNHRDNAPVQDAAVEIQGADDSGLPALLEHVEGTINDYLLRTNWPRLRFEFVNKNPKIDSRSYEFRKQAMTWGEARAEADLPKLTTVYAGDLKPLAEIMEGCPEDPAKSGVYQTVAVAMLQAQLGTDDGEGGGGGSKIAKPGPRMLPKKDPAVSQAHGHLAGTRRDSKSETGNT